MFDVVQFRFPMHVSFFCVDDSLISLPLPLVVRPLRSPGLVVRSFDVVAVGSVMARAEERLTKFRDIAVRRHYMRATRTPGLSEPVALRRQICI